MRLFRFGFALVCALAFVVPGGRARACASCGCGDPTLTATGVERPYRNRVRVGLDERYGSLTFGAGEHSDFLRSSLLASWSPTSWLTASALLPWQTSWISEPGQPRALVSGLGDLELQARAVVFRERSFAPHHLLWAGAGIKTPTGPRLRDDQGYPYPDDDQPGSGSWDPFFGATYAWMPGGITSLFASTSYRLTTANSRGYRRGSTLGFSAAVQIQPWHWGAVQLGLDGAWAQPDTLSNGNAVPNMGGTAVYVAPALMASPLEDLLIKLTVDVPAIKALDGTLQNVGPQVALSIAYDVR